MPNLKDDSVVAALQREAEMDGFTEGTEAFEKRVRQLKVVKCREMRGHATCTDCEVFDYCETAKQVMREHRGY